MKSAQTFKILAVLNLGLGALFALSTLSISVSFLRGAKLELVTFFLTAFLAAIAFSLVQAGWNHLRAATCKTALALAANTSVVIFGIVASAFRSDGYDHAVQAAISLGAILVAYAIYRWLLRPLAIRGFAPEPKNA